MKFDVGIEPQYIKSIEDAFAVILEKGNKSQKFIANEILASEMTMCVHPVIKVNASGITGVIDPARTNKRIKSERLSLRDALGEIFITIAKETIDTGGQRGCQGTIVHEGRHAYDFARVIESFSNANETDAKVFNPTLYELEWAAHKTSGDYLIRIGREEYLDEGLQLMILKSENGVCEVCDDGIKQRLQQNYSLNDFDSPGQTAAEMFGLKERVAWFGLKRFFGFGS
jgi:hypothetical protein